MGCGDRMQGLGALHSPAAKDGVGEGAAVSPCPSVGRELAWGLWDGLGEERCPVGTSGCFPFPPRGPSLPTPHLLPGLHSFTPSRPRGDRLGGWHLPHSKPAVHWILSLHRTQVRPPTDKLTHIRKSNTHTHTHISQKSMSRLLRHKEDPQPVSPVPNTKTEGPKANAGGRTKHKEGPAWGVSTKPHPEQSQAVSTPGQCLRSTQGSQPFLSGQRNSLGAGREWIRKF